MCPTVAFSNLGSTQLLDVISSEGKKPYISNFVRHDHVVLGVCFMAFMENVQHMCGLGSNRRENGEHKLAA